MFKRVTVDKETREKHFASLARRYALDAKMMRSTAAVHVENKSDIVFWGAVLKHYRPHERFHFISSSRNEYGKETSGVTQALKYCDYLSRDFFICIDSDYRFLLNEKGIDAKHFILQTYTYSYENHMCYAAGLNDVCERVTRFKNNVFSFKKFLEEYSYILYELFIWHLYFQGNDSTRFSKYEFNKYINITACRKNFSIKNNAAVELDDLQNRVEKKLDYFRIHYPKVDLEYIKERYRELGLEPATTYFYLRGHNVYDMISRICKDVCKAILRKEGDMQNNRSLIAALYNERNDVDAQLHKNIRYDAYDAIRKIESDIKQMFENSDL